jgi:hypothetical protein
MERPTQDLEELPAYMWMGQLTNQVVEVELGEQVTEEMDPTLRLYMVPEVVAEEVGQMSELAITEATVDFQVEEAAEVEPERLPEELEVKERMAG